MADSGQEGHVEYQAEPSRSQAEVSLSFSSAETSVMKTYMCMGFANVLENMMKGVCVPVTTDLDGF